MKLSHLFEVAYNKINSADCAVQNIWSKLIFEDFDEKDLPNISYTITEIFLEWRGKELHEEDIINIMESQGFITPTDFDKIKE